MNKNWTFGKKLAGGYAVMVVLSLVMSMLAIYALRAVVTSKDRVISTNAQVLIEVGKLQIISLKRGVVAKRKLLCSFIFMARVRDVCFDNSHRASNGRTRPSFCAQIANKSTPSGSFATTPSHKSSTVVSICWR